MQSDMANIDHIGRVMEVSDLNASVIQQADSLRLLQSFLVR